MNMEKDKFGKWFIKSYWKAMLYVVSVMLLIIGYSIYVLFIAEYLRHNHIVLTGFLGIIVAILIILLPGILLVIGLGIYWVYSDYKKYKGDKKWIKK